jgi:CheY-like chemotaxis protein/CRP-like cAMP-binding protein
MTKVLIIEDNEDIRENVVEILELSGYNVAAAENGKIGVELALKFHPDIVLCDIMMPEMDGYDVLQALNTHPETQATPFIFLTAKAERTDVRRGMELGADDYLTKPFDDAELLRAIESRMKRKQVQQLFYGKSAQQLNEFITKKDGLAELKNVMQERNTKKYKKNQHIHYDGDRVTGIYFIISGKVKTVKMTEDGRELITGMYKADDYLDVNIIFSNDVYTDTAIALEETELSFLPTDQLDKLLYLHPDIGARFIKLLAHDIKDKEDRLMQIAYSSVRKRVAEVLVKLITNHSKDNKSIKIGRDDLAALSGTSPETVSRTLTDFKDEGLIDKQASTVTVLNLDKLSRMKN